MAETPNVMPSLHMPLQSGSDKVLKDMRRSYRQSKYLGIIDRVRAAMPDAAITTDIIVGFPGETEEDFQATLDVVRAARFSGAFTFQYSKRPGTPAAVLDGAGAEGASCRSATSAWSRWPTRSRGRRTARSRAARSSCMVAEGEGRKDAATHRLSGRAPRQPAGALHPGDDAAGDPGRRTPRRHGRGRRHRTALRTTSSPTARCSPCAVPAPVTPGRPAPPPSPSGVSLGLPTLGVPAPLPVETGCSR